MFDIKQNLIALALATGMIAAMLLGFGYITNAVILYPPSASLGTDDIVSNMIKDGTIVNADVNVAAGFELGKISITEGSLMTGTAGGIGRVVSMSSDGVVLIGNGSYPEPHTISGDVGMTKAGVMSVSDLTISSETHGDILYRGASTWNRVAAGSSGEFLQSQGAAAAPQWATGSGITFCDTSVFSGTSPSAWTDLDLSGTIGSNSALVYLRVHQSAGNDREVAFRENGEAKILDSNAGMTGIGCTGGFIENDDVIYIWVLTDTAGIVEWWTSSAQANWTINLRAYMK